MLFEIPRVYRLKIAFNVSAVGSGENGRRMVPMIIFWRQVYNDIFNLVSFASCCVNNVFQSSFLLLSRAAVKWGVLVIRSELVSKQEFVKTIVISLDAIYGRFFAINQTLWENFAVARRAKLVRIKRLIDRSSFPFELTSKELVKTAEFG